MLTYNLLLVLTISCIFLNLFKLTIKWLVILAILATTHTIILIKLLDVLLVRQQQIMLYIMDLIFLVQEYKLEII
jgi:hypothetical protein